MYKAVMNFSHETLGSFMPWHSGWCDDGEGNPCTNSVMLASMLTLTHVYMSHSLTKLYKN
jgi:hypothetical protein